MNTSAQLKAAREALAATQATARQHINALRRWASAQGMTSLRQARCAQFERDRDAAYARQRAESAAAAALRDFRAIALHAAFTRLVETDRQLAAV